MDFRILSYGRNNSIEEIVAPSNNYLSGCYFDWINFQQIHVEGKAKEDIWSKSYKDILNSRFVNLENSNIQDMMLLFSEDVPNGFLMNSSTIYFSMINLNRKFEKIGGEKYANKKYDIKNEINKICHEYSEHLRLYDTFDHCDLILVCDGDFIALNDYMKILYKIRKIKTDSFCGNSDIHDITTLYGFNLCSTIESPEMNIGSEDITLTLNLNLKDVDFIDEFIKKLTDEINIPMPKVLELFGRYDNMIIWENINSVILNQIIYHTQKNLSNFFAYHIYIGLNGKNNEYNYNGSCIDQINQSLIETAKTRFSVAQEFKNILEKPFWIALYEIHQSICSMLSSGFAQYYVLCFYESFYSFIEHLKHINEKNINITELENITNMYRTYFGFLNSLNSCMLHNEHKFLQINSCQFLYFDAPPKLLAFYTAMANKMALALNTDRKNKYTFLITPDFKNDIFVDSLTNDKTIGKEHNILIIHINEESIYDVTKTLRILAHEISHHIGQDANMRKTRASLYIKCFLAYIVSYCFSNEFLIGENFELKYKFYCDFIDAFSKEFLSRKDWNINILDDLLSTETMYYTKNFVEKFLEYINAFLVNNNPDPLYKALKSIKITDTSYIKEYGGDYWINISNIYSTQNNSQDMITDFFSKYIAEIEQKNIVAWSLKNDLREVCDIVTYIFSESYADAKMLKLFSQKENYINEYQNMMIRPFGNLEYDDEIRSVAVLTYLSQESKKPDSVMEFEKLKITEDGKSVPDIMRCFPLFLRDSIVKYLKLIDTPTNKEYNIYHEDIIKNIEAFESNDLKCIVACVEKEICDYQNRLCDIEDFISL